VPTNQSGACPPPVPTASVVCAMIAEAELFLARWRPCAEGPGIDPEGGLTVQADGAAWIWAAAGAHFLAAALVLDIFHASHDIAAGKGGGHFLICSFATGRAT
jgi:hypothetical protein